ncbi:MAG TPA: exodeoxyribonuclease III [Arenicellales bacterium]|nr:exodeoxyribonuclease III [Arenicellales bacterium]
MKIATWNVNSLKVRLPQVLDWLRANEPDVLCIQETKLQDQNFPVADFEALGYRCAFSGQKTYNGVAVVARSPIEDVVTDLPGLEDPQRRVLSATIDGFRVVNLYVPNGQEVGSEKYQYKLNWLEHLVRWAGSLRAESPRVVICGDFNIAPEDRDVHDPELWRGKVLCSEPERDAFRALLDAGYKDAFRKFEQPDAAYSWWDYRAAAFRRNMGLRIDHILCSDALYDAVAACSIDVEPRRLERPSDHAPVVAEFAGSD